MIEASLLIKIHEHFLDSALIKFAASIIIFSLYRQAISQQCLLAAKDVEINFNRFHEIAYFSQKGRQSKKTNEGS